MENVATAVDPFVFRLSIFVLAVFVGYYVVWSVTPALHTPLMSVTNAISSVIVVGALLAVGVALAANDNGPLWARALGFVALVFASVNIFGGFLFILAVRGLSTPDSSRRGNLFGMIGMAIAVFTTLGSHPPASPLAWG